MNIWNGIILRNKKLNDPKIYTTPSFTYMKQNSIIRYLLTMVP